MASIDYIVVTWLPSEALSPSILARLYRLIEASEAASLYGARGKKGKCGFAGELYDGRIILVSTGANANTIALSALSSFPQDGRSIARLDLQVTCTVEDADYLILRALPSKRYKSYRYAAIHERGATLYVGSPRSDARLRIYNKSAESGIRSEDGKEYIRYEMQFRNRYADLAWNMVSEGLGNQCLVNWVSKMIPDGVTDAFLEGWLSIHGQKFSSIIVESDDDALARRKRWIEHSVVPALRKIVALDPNYLDVLYSLVIGNKGSEPNISDF